MQTKHFSTLMINFSSIGLTPCDFSKLGLLKENLFSEKPLSFENFKELMTEHFDVLCTPQLCSKVCKSVPIENVFHMYRQWRWWSLWVASPKVYAID